MGRLQNLPAQARAGLSALATGILIFLLWDVLRARGADRHGPRGAPLGHVWWLALVGLAGFTLGLMSLVYYSEWMRKKAHRRSSTLVGPGAAASDEFESRGFIEGLRRPGAGSRC